MQIKVKKLHNDAVLPEYAKPGDAAMDVRAVHMNITANYIEYDTGLAFEVSRHNKCIRDIVKERDDD